MELETLTQPATLESIQSVLEYQNYPAQIQPLKPDSPFQQLLVGPGKYMSGPGVYDDTRPVFMLICFVNDVLQAVGQSPDPYTDTLQISILLPFQVPEPQVRQVFQLMAIFNGLLPLGCFGLHVDGTPYFRYCLKMVDRELDGLLLLETLDKIFFFVERMGYKFEEIATGKKDWQSISQEEIDFRPPGKP